MDYIITAFIFLLWLGLFFYSLKLEEEKRLLAKRHQEVLKELEEVIEMIYIQLETKEK